MRQIRPDRVATCVFCADQIETTARGSWRKGSGWFPVGRTSNNRKGTNAASLVRMEDRYACDLCIGKIKGGIPPGQMSMFELGEYDDA